MTSTTNLPDLSSARADRGQPRRLSVIIANRNYARFLGESIDSALALDWPEVEVIVIDNGSTDNSRSVIERYGSNIRAVFQEDKGHLEACNRGFALSTGDVVMFLDADDRAHPELMHEVAAVWSDRVSKVQVQARVIDGGGRPSGGVFPAYHVTLTPQSVRAWAKTTGTYPTPPGAGNIYSRRFLEQIFPLTLVAGHFSDSCPIAAAPYLGDVVTIRKPLVDYRIHGANGFSMQTLDPNRFVPMLQNSLGMFEFARTIARGTGADVPPAALESSLHTLMIRAACYRLTPQLTPVRDESRSRIVRGLWRGLWTPQGFGRLQAMAAAIWGVLVLVAPERLARRLIGWRFASLSRPPFVRRLLVATRVVRG